MRLVRLANTILLKQGMTQYLAPEVFIGRTLPVDTWACAAVSCQLLYSSYIWSFNLPEASCLVTTCIMVSGTVTTRDVHSQDSHLVPL